MENRQPARVVVSDPFWSPRLEVNARRAIFHQWDQLEASGCIANFRILAGDQPGFREGWFFADSDAYKWLDAAARIYAGWPQERLAAMMDDFIALLARCQTGDGYLFTYNQIHFTGQRWQNLQIEHELYCHGHLVEAGVSHYQATGQSAMLAIARRAADLLVKDFLDAGSQRTPGHEEVELALLRLYQVTGHSPYLELAAQFLEQRGRTPFFAFHLLRQNASVSARRKAVAQKRRAYQAGHPAAVLPRLPENNFAKRPPFSALRWNVNALSGKYFQQHVPIRRQSVPVGHAVRFGYLETAIAMLYRLRPDATLLPAMQDAWERMVARRMYVTGGLGALPSLEGFGRDDELDPEYAYAETCAALAGLFWNWEMAQITPAAKYSDLFEWQLYNAAAVGMGWSGENYLYNNPLACRGGITRKAWYAVPCCPSNISRTWADLGKYIFSASAADIWVHQYIGSRASFDLGGPLQVELESELPWAGRIGITLSPSGPQEFSLHLRLPAWCAEPSVVIRNPGTGLSMALDPGTATAVSFPAAGPATAQGYDPRHSRFLSIQRLWLPGDRVELALDTPLILRRAHPRVKGCQGKVALTRGPLVYCLESLDNPGVDLFNARLDPSSLQVDAAADLFGGVTLLRGRTIDGAPLTFIPYQLWANRGESQMTVWVKT